VRNGSHYTLLRGLPKEYHHFVFTERVCSSLQNDTGLDNTCKQSNSCNREDWFGTYAVHATSLTRHAVGTRNNPNQKYPHLKTIPACEENKYIMSIFKPLHAKQLFTRKR